jgi:spore maturation protein CgeB
VLGGSQYPVDFPWTSNLFYMQHVAPAHHPAFYSSSRLTLNVTRRPMAETGFCPSGRLFEAAACGVPILTDDWEGLDQFFHPDTEILVGHTTADAVAALERGDGELRRIADAALERTLAEHTAARRAIQLEQILEGSSLVGNHTGRGSWHAHSAAGVLEGTPAGGEPV